MEQKFKTTINCENCKAKVSPFLDKNEKIESWQVDLTHDDRILTIKGNIHPDEVAKTTLKAGFKAEPV